MRRSRALVIFLVLASIVALAPDSAHSQLENNTWYFGANEGLDFSTNPPTLLTNGSQYCFEGSASISDPTTGKLLFYTDGISVWNRAHRLMPNGTGLSSHWSATQPALMIPDPGDPSKYYIFTADHSGYGGAVRGINYSKVDMTLEGGFGDVTVKNSQLLGWASEKLTAVKICDGSAYWVIAHGYFNSKFYAWRVDKNGVSNPVVSEVGSYHGPALDDGVGWMSASPDATMLALAFFTRTDNNIELFRFDAFTGIVSNGLTIGNGFQPYGITFSPENKKLYATSIGRIDQYDVTVWDAQTITNSWSPLNSSAQENGAIKIGPDGKIYVQHSAYIGVISQPELTGIECQYTEAAIRTSDGAKYGLPNNVDASANIACGLPDANIRTFPGPICEAECVSFMDSSQFGPTSWQWEFEGAVPSTSTARNPVSICYPTAGTYKVQLTVSNATGPSTDIKYVTVQKCEAPEITLNDTSICATKCVTFSNTDTAAYTRHWEFAGGKPASYFGDTPPPICYDSAGVFTVKLIAMNAWGSHTAIATVTVNDCPGPVARSEHDTVVCIETSVVFTDRSTNAPTAWEWNFEGGTPATASTKDAGPITYDKPGVYEVRQVVQNSNGVDTSYTQIRVIRCDPPIAKLTDRDVCQGDCIDLIDQSLLSPTSWLWTLTGPATESFAVKDPGQLCFAIEGIYQLTLVVANEYGSDSTTSTITVRSAAGWTSGALAMSQAVPLCASLDTFFTVYSGCSPLEVGSINSSDIAVLVANNQTLLGLYDSLRIPVRISPTKLGSANATLSLMLGSVAHSIAISYSTVADPEQFSFSAFDGEFKTLACEPQLQSLLITNEACADQTIVYLGIEPQNPALVLVLSDLDFTIESGSSKQIGVQYDANIAGSATAELVIRTGGGLEKRYALAGDRLLPASGKLRVVAAGPTSLLPNQPTSVRLAFEAPIESYLAPSVIEMSLSYNSDIVSPSAITPHDGWAITNRTETSNGLNLTLARTRSPIAAGAGLVEIEFSSFVAKQSTTEFAVDRLVCDPEDPDFERCVFDLEISDTTRIAVLPICGSNTLMTGLANEQEISLIIKPHPIRAASDLKFTLSVQLADHLGQTVSASLIDMAGHRIDLFTASLSDYQQTFGAPLLSVGPGVYILEVLVGSLKKRATFMIH